MRFLLLALPWLELLTLIQLGVATSALTAMGYVLLTVVIGVGLLQRQGRGMVDHLRRAQAGAMPPGQWLLDDMVTGLAGVLLIIPGMLTDVMALLILIGPLRRLLARRFQRSEVIINPADHTARDPEVIEGTYHRVDEG